MVAAGNTMGESRVASVQAKAVEQLATAIPAVGVVALVFSPAVREAVAGYIDATQMGSSGLANAGLLMLGATGVYSLLMDVQRASRTWNASKTFSSMVKGFLRTEGLDPSIEADVRRFTSGHGKDPLLISLDRAVKQGAVAPGAVQQLWAVTPDGLASRITNDKTYHSFFGKGLPSVRLSIREIEAPEPQDDGFSMAWPGQVEVVAYAMGSRMGRWLVDESGNTLSGSGPWADASSTTPVQKVDDTRYTPLMAPDPHVAYLPSLR